MSHKDAFKMVSTVDTDKKKEWPGYGATLRLRTQELKVDVDVRFGPLKVEKLLDMEGELVKRGPHGGEVRKTWKETWYEKVDGAETEIPSSAVGYYQGEQLVPKFSKTNVIEVDETRQVDECTLDSEGTHASGDHKGEPYYMNKSLATLIPREGTDKYLPEDMDVLWTDSVTNLMQVVNYLEKNRLSILAPFSHGNGRRIITTTISPIRRNGQLYLVMVLSSGEILWSHPLEATSQPVEEKRMVIAPPVLFKKKKPQPS